jgi:hypothetical protein
MMSMDKKRAFTVILCIVPALAVLFFTGGCKPKDNTARITFNVEGQEFSDAELSIDNKSAGRMEQTIIKTDGELFINGQLAATLPPGSPQIGKEDACSGVLDSITLKAGDHTISLYSSEGKTLQIAANVSQGYHLVTYSSARETIKWDNETVKVIPGTPVTIKGTIR